jgi:hypothetical protein
MNKLPLSHNDFDGQVQGMSRRAILCALSEGHYRFDSPIIKRLKTIRNYTLVILAIVAIVLSAMAITDWHAGKRGFEHGFRNAYYEKNKVKPADVPAYVGAGDDTVQGGK